MKKNHVIILVIAILAIGVAVWLLYGDRMSGKSASDGQPSQTISYLCAQGKTIVADYYEGQPAAQPAPGEPPIPTGDVSLALSDGRSISLPRTISGDGMRYANADESVIFWSKGDTAFVMESGAETFSACVRSK